MEGAYRSAVAESDRWKRREMLVRQQIAGINAQAEKLERDADALDAERDVLEHERDATKAALAKASKRSGFAVLPYKGPNGTWRRPIVIECAHGGANLQPHGPNFAAIELSPRINPKSSTFIRAIARELVRIHSADTPDGTPAVPYIVFLVRPDGIAPYYLARTSLEHLGIAFGYELVDQHLAINIPDFDDLTTWDGSVPLDVPLVPAPGSSPISRRLAQANQTNDQSRTALAGLPPGDQGSMIGAIDGDGRGTRGGGGQGLSSSGSSQPQDFVWPGRGPRADQRGRRSAGAPAPANLGASSVKAISLLHQQTDLPAGMNRTEGQVLSYRSLVKTSQAPTGRTPAAAQVRTTSRKPAPLLRAARAAWPLLPAGAEDHLAINRTVAAGSPLTRARVEDSGIKRAARRRHDCGRRQWGGRRNRRRRELRWSTSSRERRHGRARHRWKRPGNWRHRARLRRKRPRAGTHIRRRRKRTRRWIWRRRWIAPGAGIRACR